MVAFRGCSFSFYRCQWSGLCRTPWSFQRPTFMIGSVRLPNSTFADSLIAGLCQQLSGIQGPPAFLRVWSYSIKSLEVSKWLSKTTIIDLGIDFFLYDWSLELFIILSSRKTRKTWKYQETRDFGVFLKAGRSNSQSNEWFLNCCRNGKVVYWISDSEGHLCSFWSKDITSWAFEISGETNLPWTCWCSWHPESTGSTRTSGLHDIRQPPWARDRNFQCAW